MDEPSKENTLTLRELRKISKILILANASTIEKELLKIANTDARKKMWVLIDGKRVPKDIAKEAGVTQMAVSYFLDAASAAELVEYAKREPPRRILDYVPPSWIDLVIKERGEEEHEALKEAKDKTSEKEPAPQAIETDSTIAPRREKGDKNEHG